jgi:hypothetical protein
MFPFVNANDVTYMAKKHKKFSLWAKKRLLDLDLTVTQLAARIGYPRQTVSAAINGSERFPHVTSAIATSLNYDSKTNGPLPTSPARPEQRLRLATA